MECRRSYADGFITGTLAKRYYPLLPLSRASLRFHAREQLYRRKGLTLFMCTFDTH